MTPSLLTVALMLSQDFEAASVKPAPASNNGRFSMSGGPGTSDPGFLRYSNIPLKRVLILAFDAKPWQIIGPDWLNSLRFDISARVPEGTTKEQSVVMLRNLLTERFRMAVHREAKERSFYALVTEKNGPKLKSAAAETGDENSIATVKQNEGKDGFPVLTPGAPGLVIETRGGSARVSGFQADLSKLADFLATQLGRPVLDQTGLGGTFDFVVYYAVQNAAANDGSPYPGIFEALREQLGLRLEGRKGPVEMLMIDRVEKIPTENE